MYGSVLFDPNSTRVTTSQIATYAENFLRGFWSTTPVNGTYLYLCIGTNNQPRIDGVVNVTNAHGKAWGQLINTVNSWISSTGFGNQELAYGGSDMEVGWNSYANTSAWVTGYNSTACYLLYDYGDDAGNGNANGNNWGESGVYFVAYGGTLNYPVPEIYCSDDVTKDWAVLNAWAKSNKGNYMNFRGSMTEYKRDSSTNTPATGWSELNTAVSPYQGTLPYSTDINYSN